MKMAMRGWAAAEGDGKMTGGVVGGSFARDLERWRAS